ncbi:efflux RND transporter permease subunit [Pseudooceanicola sp. HF7]|uniref:efflux RND transporter permease subunit n=1 Tax=Pseudooceanicola sp. HF7 TaxID=2721560 RepID=UPI00143098E4|nr:efflux RND transporter permease subunit [Pseudooceanicola sp. HF7]NIZ10647.1 efflux RND transporter permease subunit [Pseudooceanicola sp. HF7]
MTGLVDWAASRARMILAFIALSIAAGAYAYATLPKEGEPDIEIPALFVSVPFMGISAEDSETLLIKPMETEFSDLDGLKTMTSTAAEGYAGVALEFEFGWDKTKTMADVRDAMGKAEANFPEGYDSYSVNEINFSEFPIIIVNLTGQVPERTMARIAEDLQEKLESLDAVLEAGIAGNRDQMVEVVIDPIRLESYNVTAAELLAVVQNNNQLIAAGDIDSAAGSFAVKIPGSFDELQDIYELPVKLNGDRVVTLGDLASIRMTYEDRTGTARFNGETTIALQVVKRKGFNIIDTATRVKEVVAEQQALWPQELQTAVHMGTSNDQSRVVGSMVEQLEGSVLTAIALVMIVVLAALGPRPAVLVGFSIPTSFLLCFVLLSIMGITVSNIVMFGLILAVGMLVDGAIVVVEYADKRISEGTGPMHAYVEAAKRMFWPVVSSTATTLCAFLPMLFWPGIVGQFMGMLPVTLIFVLSASLIVALIYLPVMGGVIGRLARAFDGSAAWLRRTAPAWLRLALVPLTILGMYMGAMLTINPGYLSGEPMIGAGPMASLPGILLFLLATFATSIVMGSVRRPARAGAVRTRSRTPFGWLMWAITANPVMPIVTAVAVVGFVVATFGYYGSHQKGVEFFVESEPEQAIVYVRARGNLSLQQKDALVAQVETVILRHPGVKSAFAFAGEGGLDSNTGGAEPPLDTIGQINLEIIPWEDRSDRPDLDGNRVIDELTAAAEQIPGIKIEILAGDMGPASAKPVHLRLKGDDWDTLIAATELARDKFEQIGGLTLIEDTLPLPGIDWQIDVDVEKAGRYGADVATVGAMVQLITQGLELDTMPVETSDEEISIRLRLPEEDRVLSTLDTLKVRTPEGLVPLSNFITRRPVEKLAQIKRVDQTRYFDVKAAVETGLTTTTTAPRTGETIEVPMTPNERIERLTEWLDSGVLPAGIDYEWTGDQEDQAESETFLMTAFSASLALMFIILLAQFNSFYNSVLVLLAVVMSTAGVLIGMLVMDQAFSIIMTGTGIVALAGIVVNNNIVLIDTYQEYSAYMPRIEAIIRTAEDRIRPVLLTTITTMAGLAPMMFGLSLDFLGGGYSIDSPTALWWKQLATAVVFGLGIATVLTLVFTPSMLALRVWAGHYVLWIARGLASLSLGRSSQAAQDWALRRAARRVKHPEILWPLEAPLDTPDSQGLRAAE